MSIADDAKPISDAESEEIFAELSAEPVLVLAVSGGPDSTALAYLAARWRKRFKRGPTLLVVTIDHGLRPEARQEALQVKRLAAKLGLNHRILRWTGPKPSSGLQAKARDVRYKLLAQAAIKAKARCILTAHTLDDQAETILFRMARGSGLSGLAGMARITPMPDFMLVRPFLDLPKTRLLATLKAAGIPFSDDPSNANLAFTRVRMRALLPALAREGLDARRFAIFARRIASAEKAIAATVDGVAAVLAPLPWKEKGPIVIDTAGFRVLPREISLRLLGRVIAHVGNEGPVELGKLENLCDALLKDIGNGGARFRRTLAGAIVTFHREKLTVERAPARRHRPLMGKRGSLRRPEIRKKNV